MSQRVSLVLNDFSDMHVVYRVSVIIYLYFMEDTVRVCVRVCVSVCCGPRTSVEFILIVSHAHTQVLEIITFFRWNAIPYTRERGEGRSARIR